MEHVKDTLPDDNGAILVTCISITSGLGRPLFGVIADYPRVNRIFLQQISFVSIGFCTMLLVAAPYFTGFEFESMIVFALIMGLFDGCFITMLGPIAYDICGPAGASQGIGFLLGLCSVPLTVGPLMAGYFYDWLGNYTLAFIVAGIPPIFGACFMTLIYKVGNKPNHLDVTIEQPEDKAEEEEEGSTLMPSRTAISTLSTEPLENGESESLLVTNGEPSDYLPFCVFGCNNFSFVFSCY